MITVKNPCLRFLPALLLVVPGVQAVPCAAHPANIAAATAKVQPDGRFQVQVRFDLLAFVLDDTPIRIGDSPMNALLDGPTEALRSQLADAAGRFRRDFKVSGGTGPGTIDALKFPTAAEVQQWRDSDIKPRLPVLLSVIVQGHLPAHTPSVSFRFPNVLGPIVLTTEFPFQEPISEPLDAGAFSNPLPMPATAAGQSILPAPRPVPVLVVRRHPAVPIPRAALTSAPHPVQPTPTARLTAPAAPPSLINLPSAPLPGGPQPAAATAAPPAAMQVKVTPVAPANKMPVTSQPVPTRPPQATPQPAAAATAGTVTHTVPWIVLVLRYVKMGFNHILPEGLDHILFVLGLFLLSTRTKALLWQITAFTVAHSLTLALSLYGVLRLPSSVVEPIIALSIAFVAIENLFTTELKPWRPFVVFGFGLVHGMGFAGALKDLGLQRHDFLTALLGFNVGVELGQLSVVLLAMLAVGWFRKKPNYRKTIVLPGSFAIAAVALFWTVQRIFFQG